MDEPQGFKNSVPPVVDATGPNAYIRFHGRNATTWEESSSSSADRFDWWYTEDELSEWLPKMEFLEREAGTVFALFNTNNANQATANGQLLLNLLEK